MQYMVNCTETCRLSRLPHNLVLQFFYLLLQRHVVNELQIT